MITATERIKSIKDRLDPVDADDLWDIINELLTLRNENVLRTVEDWLFENYPNEEETKDIVNTPKFWAKNCCCCQYRNKAKQITYEDTDLCNLINTGCQMPVVCNITTLCKTRKFDPV